MALENAKKFVQMIQNDEALKARIEKMSPAEALAAAKELGLDFTEEEFKDAPMDQAMALDELDEVTGGIPKLPTNFRKGACSKSPSGNHEWEKTGHVEYPHKFLWMEYTMGYDQYRCIYCGQTKEKHV